MNRSKTICGLKKALAPVIHEVSKFADEKNWIHHYLCEETQTYELRICTGGRVDPILVFEDDGKVWFIDGDNETALLPASKGGMLEAHAKCLKKLMDFVTANS